MFGLVVFHVLNNSSDQNLYQPEKVSSQNQLSRILMKQIGMIQPYCTNTNHWRQVEVVLVESIQCGRPRAPLLGSLNHFAYPYVIIIIIIILLVTIIQILSYLYYSMYIYAVWYVDCVYHWKARTCRRTWHWVFLKNIGK